jgi:hypothetical protein
MFRLFRGKQKPPVLLSDPQPDPPSPVYAFRTITTMLSLIHRSGKLNRDLITNDSKELRILDALAAIIIRKHGVAATAVAVPHEGSRTIQVLTSVSHPNSYTIPQSELPSESGVAESLPIVVDPERTIPQSLRDVRDKPASVLLEAFLAHDW